MQQPRWILASDIDHTLTGDPETLKKLAAKIDTLREQKSLLYFAQNSFAAGVEEGLRHLRAMSTLHK